MRPAPIVVEKEALARAGADWVARELVETVAGGQRDSGGVASIDGSVQKNSM